MIRKNPNDRILPPIDAALALTKFPIDIICEIERSSPHEELSGTSALGDWRISASYPINAERCVQHLLSERLRLSA